jgi:hypothetical protein
MSRVLIYADMIFTMQRISSFFLLSVCAFVHACVCSHEFLFISIIDPLPVVWDLRILLVELRGRVRRKQIVLIHQVRNRRLKNRRTAAQ